MLYNTNQTVNTLTEYYSDNESGYGGYFPVGINNTWHSGIHINNKREIYPIRPGELVAYRICENYVQTPWPKRITSTIYDKLSEKNKKLFKQKLFGGYELIDDRSKELCSNSFILLKHTVMLNKTDGSQKEFQFFTLYMNIMPLEGIYEDCKKDEYNYVSTNLEQEPFYMEWKFMFNGYTDNDAQKNIYEYKKGVNVFENSKFKIAKKDFSYAKYKELESVKDTGNPCLPADMITFLAPTSCCKVDIPFSDVKLYRKVVIFPKDIEFEVYEEGENGVKLGILKFTTETCIRIEDENEESQSTTEDETIHYLKLQFPDTTNITFLDAAVTEKESNVTYKIKVNDEIKVVMEGEIQRTGENKDNFVEKCNCLVCYTDNTKTNPAEIKSSGAEFIPQDSNCFRSTGTSCSGYVRFDTNQYYYIDIPSIKYLKAKLVVKTGFEIFINKSEDKKENKNVKVQTNKERKIYITARDLLGYPALCEQTNGTYFDLVVFSLDDLLGVEEKASFFKNNFVRYKEDSNKKDLFIEPKKLISKIDQEKFLFFWNDGLVSEKELLNFYMSQEEEIKKIRKNFYKLICQHPIEWDSNFTKKNIKNDFKNVFGHKKLNESVELWLDNISVKLTKLSVFNDSFKYATASTNLFYFMHPLYFLEKIHEYEGQTEKENNKFLPKEARDLIEIQDEVISLECLKKGGVGIYSDKNASRNQTYCNHAIFLTIIAADGNSTAFTNRKAPLSFPEFFPNKDVIKIADIEEVHKDTSFYYYKNSNYWCDILAAASKNELTGIKEVELEQAQKLANQGYVVIACRKNFGFKDGSPHFATIRPNATVTEYNIDKVSVANVGLVNKVMYVSEAFQGEGSVRYYYNSRQVFQKDMNLWNKLQTGLYKKEDT